MTNARLAHLLGASAPAPPLNANATADQRAGGLARRALKAGRLVEPEGCERCGMTERRLVKHHEDYSRPLDVLFVCDRCHRLIHGKRTQASRMLAEVPA